MRTVRVLFLPIAIVAGAVNAYPQTNPAAAFAFTARMPTGQPAGWSGGPPVTLSVDSTTFRSAPLAGRIDRTASSSGNFSTLTMKLPAVAGQTIELRGWLRLQDVQEWAGLWLRIDGAGGQVLGFDNMQARNISGTRDWAEYTIRLPLQAGAREIFLGALLAGPGTIWVDDLQLLVDGKPYQDAPARTPDPADTAFTKGSGIDPARLAAHQIDNLVLLGKVWGFAKYHHPRITSGKLNWDNELFRVLPQVLAAGHRAAAVRAIDAWLAHVGDSDPCRPCAAAPVQAQIMPAIDWIGDPAVTGALGSRLRNIYLNRHANGPQYYVSQTPNVGNPVFDAEVAYRFQPVPDAGYRLLALYRFWNIIEYWFPYRDVMNENWNAVLAEFIPRFVAADDSAAYRLELMRLSARIHDTHSNTWGDLGLRPPRGDAELPVTVRFIEGKAVVTGFTHDALGAASGLQRGDVIERIGGRRVDSLVVAWRPFYSASNEPTRLRDMGFYLTRGDTGMVRVTVERNGRRLAIDSRRVLSKQLNLARARVHELPGEAFQMLPDSVAYIKISTLKRADVRGYLQRAAGTRVLVIDLRNYPSDFPLFELGGHLVEKPTDFARFTTGDLANPGAFAFRAGTQLTPAQPHFTGKVVILVDEVTQSSAEYHAMAFRSAPAAMVVGSTTAGADGNVSRIPLPGPSGGMISGIGVFYPDGRPTQRVGIVPDLEVRPTVAGIRAGRDEVLEAAVSRALGRTWRLHAPR